MSTGLRKTGPYVIALLILAAIAIFSEDYLPFDLFGNNSGIEDTAAVEVDSIEVEDAILVDTLVKGTLSEEVAPKIVEETTVKRWRLVIASVPSISRAQEIASSVEGEAEVKYVEYIDTYRVVYNSYSSLREAQEGFDENSHQYPNAWLVYF